jgi:hypothetical protein
MSRPSGRRVALRRWLLCLALPAWAWSRSTFTPWAVSRAPRLWLYDALYYLGFALLAWAIAEVALAIFQRRRERPATLLPIAVAAGLASAILWWAYFESGLRMQLRASANDLHRVAGAGPGDVRLRAGVFLIDTVRAPCAAAEPWLWLGRPHGAGTGINRALVYSGPTVPHTPQRDAYAFWPVADGWWMAYQHARRDLAVADTPDRCAPGRALHSHRHGMAWIADGHR